MTKIKKRLQDPAKYFSTSVTAKFIQSYETNGKIWGAKLAFIYGDKQQFITVAANNLDDQLQNKNFGKNAILTITFPHNIYGASLYRPILKDIQFIDEEITDSSITKVFSVNWNMDTDFINRNVVCFQWEEQEIIAWYDNPDFKFKLGEKYEVTLNFVNVPWMLENRGSSHYETYEEIEQIEQDNGNGVEKIVKKTFVPTFKVVNSKPIYYKK